MRANPTPILAVIPLVLLAVGLGGARSVEAANTYWKGGLGGVGHENDFNIAANWTAGVPGSGDAAYFDTTATTKTVVLTANQSINSFQFYDTGFEVNNDANGPWRLTTSNWSNV